MPERVGRCEFLFVPGLLTRWNVGYFAPNLERLRAFGLEARVAWSVHTMGSLARNAALMREEILRCSKPVVLVGHSKGALDAWAALAAWPALVSRVAGFVALQSPILGSEVADWYRASGLRRSMVRLAARLVGGDEEAIWDLTVPVREAFAEAFPFPAERIPAVSLVTSLRRPLHRFYLGRWVLGSGSRRENDGMVAVDRAVVPGGRVVRLEDMDHLDPVASADGIEQFFASAAYQAGTLTEALVRFLAPDLRA